MTDPSDLEARIRAAFADVEYPGDDDLRSSDEGDEPYLLEEEFRGKDDWSVLDSHFIDAAPDGFSTALTFFSRAALRFYLPAYLIADLAGSLLYTDPVFNLCHGFEPSSAEQHINPKRFGDMTWNDYARERFADFTPEQAAVVAAYLEIKLAEAMTEFERTQIAGALDSYWRPRAGGAPEA